MVKDQYPEEWLLPLEIYEIFAKEHASFEEEVLAHLNQLAMNKKFTRLISDGLALAQH